MAAAGAVALAAPVFLPAASAAEATPASDAAVTLTASGFPPNGTSWEVGDQVTIDIQVTNTSGRHKGFRPTASNMTNVDGCRWQWMPPNSPQSCKGRARYTVTQEDVDSGSLHPSITYSTFESAGYAGPSVAQPPVTAELPRNVESTPDDPDNPTVTGTFEVLNPKLAGETFGLGETINYRLTFTNNSSTARSLFVASSNLGSSSYCRSSWVGAGQSTACSLASHTVTAEDIAAGSFTPVMSLGGTASTGYTGAITRTADISGEAVPVGGPTSFEAAKPFTSPDANPFLEAGASEPVTLSSSQDGMYNIRIPAIATAPNGDLLASYDRRPLDGGANGGDSPNANWIVQRRSTDGGKTWGPETVIARGETAPSKRIGFSDPSYVVDASTGTVFNFHVQSYDSGIFANSPNYNRGEDGRIIENNRHAVNLGLSVSKDNGRTWTERVITAQALHDKTDLQSCFATSGAGIQKKAAPHAGRLIQQVACIKLDGTITAFSLYSDDHGETWSSGAYTTVDRGEGEAAWRFDENKVAELSDGRLLLNSRTTNASPGGGHRLVAISEDGGETWGETSFDEELLDSGNNAQLIRAYPNAKPGSARSKVLLYSGALNQGQRTNGTVLASCDNGETWAHRKELIPGGTGYTTMAVQSDGSIGLLYEPRIWHDVAYMRFTLADIAPKLCEAPDLQMAELAGTEARDGEAITPIKIAVSGGDEGLKHIVRVTGLPAGLSYDAEQGAIVGTPAAGIAETQTYEVSIFADEEADGTGLEPRSASRTFTLTLTPGEKKVEPAPQPSEPSEPAPSDKPSEPSDPAPSDKPAEPAPSDQPSDKPSEPMKPQEPGKPEAPKAEDLAKPDNAGKQDGKADGTQAEKSMKKDAGKKSAKALAATGVGSTALILAVGSVAVGAILRRRQA